MRWEWRFTCESFGNVVFLPLPGLVVLISRPLVVLREPALPAVHLKPLRLMLLMMCWRSSTMMMVTRPLLIRVIIQLAVICAPGPVAHHAMLHLCTVRTEGLIWAEWLSITGKPVSNMFCFIIGEVKRRTKHGLWNTAVLERVNLQIILQYPWEPKTLLMQYCWVNSTDVVQQSIPFSKFQIQKTAGLSIYCKTGVITVLL